MTPIKQRFIAKLYNINTVNCYFIIYMLQFFTEWQILHQINILLVLFDDYTLAPSH